MLKKRIIPCLDMKDGKVVKGINFINLKNIGDPIKIAKNYEKQGASEIVFLDITATNENRQTTKEVIIRGASELNIPITVGGGMRTIEEIQAIFDCGASKISINSAAVKNPALIKEASSKFGKEKIVVAIDVKDEFVYINGGNTKTDLDPVKWAKECEGLGAGEILLTSKDCDGAKKGYDIKLTKAVTDAVNIPVIASGGCGSIQDIVEVFLKTNCDAALVASLFHYGEATVSEVKQELEKYNMNVRRV